MPAFTVTVDPSGRVLRLFWPDTAKLVKVSQDAFVATAVPASPDQVDISGTTVRWQDATSPVAVSRAAWIAAVTALFSSSFTLSGNLDVGGNADVLGNLDVAGPVSLAGTTLVGGNLTVSGDANIVGVPRSIVQWTPTDNFAIASGDGRRSVVGWDDSYTLGPNEAVWYTGQVTFRASNLSIRFVGAYLYDDDDNFLVDALVDFTNSSSGMMYASASFNYIWTPGAGAHATDLRVQAISGSADMWEPGTRIQRRIIYWPAGKVQDLTPTWS